MHQVENPDIRYRDSLAQDHAGEEDKYTLVLANPPFAGSLDYENTVKDLLQIVKTKKTELPFCRPLPAVTEDRRACTVIVPDGVFRSTKAHKELRRMLVEDQKLDAIIKLPSGVFRPYAGVSTAIVGSLEPTPGEQTTCGSMIWNRTAGAWTTSEHPCLQKVCGVRNAP